MASTYLSRATSDPQSSNTTATFSVWLKRSALGSDQSIWSGSYYSTSNMFNIKFEDTDKVQILCNRGGSEKANLKTNRLFRDTNAWYHFVFAIDSTQATASNRIKMYVNGVQETSFSTNTQPSQNENLYLDSGAGANYYIGQRGGSAQYFDGCMSHFHYVDGSQLAPTVFGSTDSTTGEWKINTSPSYTVGTKGFFVLKDGNSGTDQSANSNNFTVGGGTLTKTEDCPSNVFATLNSLPKSGVSFSYGNLQADNQSADWTSALATFGSSTGKWYAEFKVTDDASGTTRNMFGVCDARDVQTMSEDELGQNTSGRVGDTVGYSGNGSGNCLKNGSDQGNGFNTTYTIGDIISVALDCDNGAVYIAKNGTYLNSGSPTSGASKTGAVTITAGETYLIGGTVYSSTYQANYGNGYFGTTAVASAGTNASGNGIFEYDVPTGFTALSTKGLNL